MNPIIYLYPRQGKLITGKFPVRLPSIAGTVTAKSQRAQKPRAMVINMNQYRPMGGGDAA